MEIEGLDYNTAREQLVLSEYGRTVQKMVDHALTLTDKHDRQRCAETIVSIMQRMFPMDKGVANREQKYWDYLAIMSNFQLDIDYPFDVSSAVAIARKPEPIGYPNKNYKDKHYGRLLMELCNKLKEMPEGKERDRLATLTATQMKRDLMNWSTGSTDDERVVDDIARFTDGAIQLEPGKIILQRRAPRQTRTNDRRKRRR